MNRRLFLQTLSYLSLAGVGGLAGGVGVVGCRRSPGGGAWDAPATEGEVDALIDQRLAEQGTDYLAVLEANPNILRRSPGFADDFRKTLREHPEVLSQLETFRVNALGRLKRSDIEPRAKMVMLSAQLEKVSHAVTTCMDHFVGVHDVLKAWGHPDELALVGLFHAMYGTEYFIPDLLDYRLATDRLRLQRLVGEKTERWILQYALMRSQEFVDAASRSGAPAARLEFFEKTDVVTSEISAADFLALAELQVANAFEPFAHYEKKEHLSFVAPYVPLRAFLGGGARTAIDVTVRSREFLSDVAKGEVDAALRRRGPGLDAP